jgi:hypothetical protein
MGPAGETPAERLAAKRIDLSKTTAVVHRSTAFRRAQRGRGFPTLPRRWRLQDSSVSIRWLPPTCRSAAGAGAGCSDARPGLLDRQPEGQGELVDVIGLYLADGEGEGVLDFPEECDGVAVVELAVEAQGTVARAFRTAGRRRWGGSTSVAFLRVE